MTGSVSFFFCLFFFVTLYIPAITDTAEEVKKYRAKLCFYMNIQSVVSKLVNRDDDLHPPTTNDMPPHVWTWVDPSPKTKQKSNKKKQQQPPL